MLLFLYGLLIVTIIICSVWFIFWTSSFDLGDAKSVYVGNLPASISVADLEQEFKNFGRIKPDGVTIRNRKVSSNVCFILLLHHCPYLDGSKGLFS